MNTSLLGKLMWAVKVNSFPTGCHMGINFLPVMILLEEQYSSIQMVMRSLRSFPTRMQLTVKAPLSMA